VSGLGLAGRVAVVTGASRGIGRAVAERLADEGARLVLGSRSGGEALAAAAEACARRGAEVCTSAGDAADPAWAGALAELAQERFGRVDLLVPAAGVSLEALLASTTDRQAREVVEVNALGAVWAARAVLPAMLRQRRGCILLLSSQLASRPARGSSVYAGTKGFVEAFARGLAAEVGRKGIRVCAVAPGLVETDMTAPLRRDAPEEALSRIALRRFGRPEEVAALVAFLASDQAGWLHGAVVPLDGGLGG
jgi:3-oxoacyl-[acyl-carrier protein] reductase